MSNTPMTPERLDEIEERANAATPGPWFLDDERPLTPCVWTGYDEALGAEVAEYLTSRGYIRPGDDYPRGCNHPAENMEFIAASRTDVPDLVAEVRRLRDALEVVFDVAYPYQDEPAFDVIVALCQDTLSSDEVQP